MKWNESELCPPPFLLNLAYVDHVPVLVAAPCFLLLSNLLAWVMRKHRDSVGENSVNFNIIINMYIVEFLNFLTSMLVSHSLYVEQYVEYVATTP